MLLYTYVLVIHADVEMNTATCLVYALCVVFSVFHSITHVDTFFIKSKREVSGVKTPCVYTNSCLVIDEKSYCLDGKCACVNSYHRDFSTENETLLCSPDAIVGNNSGIWALITAIGGLLVFSGLVCLALKLFNSGRLLEPRGHYANAGAPSVILTDTGGSTGTNSRRTSKASRNSSISHQSESRRASYTMLAPPPRTGSRRTSSSSLRSQNSFRGHHSSFRENRRKPSVRRTSSSPIGTKSPRARRHLSHEVLPLYCDDLKAGPSKSGSEEKLGNHLCVRTSYEI